MSIVVLTNRCPSRREGFTGLDQGQVTCWNSWMRWSLFSKRITNETL
ncbi:hypothetical protein [Streptomyces sp. 4N124]